MLIDFFFVVAGLGLLMTGGDWLVRGAVALSLRLGAPPVIVGLTVVAFGTSAPELVVGAQAALDHADGIVFGNVVGSNIANVLLILGLPALIAPIAAGRHRCAKSWGFMMLASIVFVGLSFLWFIPWWGGALLLAILALSLWDNLREVRAARAAPPDEVADADPQAPWGRVALWLALGLVALPLGAHLLVEGAREIAEEMGVSEAAIGLTLVALGTSLPELAATVAAVRQRQASVAIGNVIGSNFFNIAAIMGIVGLIFPLRAPHEFLELDFWVMLALSAALLPLALGRIRVTRPLGAAMLAAYCAYIVIVLVPRM